MLGAALIVGIIAGMLGHWFGIAARKAVAARPRGAAILWQMPRAFTVVAVISYLVPGVSANGRWAADTIFTTGLPVATLLLFVVLRMGIVIMCFRVGTVGGDLDTGFFSW